MLTRLTRLPRVPAGVSVYSKPFNWAASGMVEPGTRTVGGVPVEEFEAGLVTLGGVAFPPFELPRAANRSPKNMANSVKVGDTVLVPVKVTAVHPQGYPSGLDAFGRPKDPTEKPSPDTLDCDLAEAVGGKIQLFVPASIVSVTK